MPAKVETPAASVVIPAPSLPPEVARRGVTEAQWRTLMNSLYPGAAGESVLMVIDYCVARKLDPLKKPCHIVPMEVKDAKTGEYRWRDVVMPGIYELRTTAMRTGLYLGHSEPEYGPIEKYAGCEAPAWCKMTFYRWHELSKQRIEFTVKTFFRECVATKKDGNANRRWAAAFIQMLTKCTEAAGLREAFPDELGGQHAAEELEYKPLIEAPEPPAQKPATIAPKEKAVAPNVEEKPTDAKAALLAAIERTGVPEAAVCEQFKIDHIDSFTESDCKLATKWIASLNAG